MMEMVLGGGGKEVIRFGVLLVGLVLEVIFEVWEVYVVLVYNLSKENFNMKI